MKKVLVLFSIDVKERTKSILESPRFYDYEIHLGFLNGCAPYVTEEPVPKNLTKEEYEIIKNSLESYEDKYNRNQTFYSAYSWNKNRFRYELKKEDENGKLRDALVYVGYLKCTTEEKIFNYFENKILTIEPEIIFLHTGMTFKDFPRTILNSLNKIKRKYYKIKLAYERRNPHLNNALKDIIRMGTFCRTNEFAKMSDEEIEAFEGLFEKNAEIFALEKLLFS